MPENIKKSKVNYRLKTIEIIEEKLECPATPDSQIKHFHFKINIGHKIVKEKKSIIVLVEVLISPREGEKQFGSIKVANIFEIENLDSFNVNKTNSFKFSPEFETEINSISISTIRGIMYTRFGGTFLNKAILPIISPKDLKLLKRIG